MSHPPIYTHEAMKTAFSIRLDGASETFARSATQAAFAHLDEIEGKLSRYRAGSDVWQINHMEAGQSLFVSDLTEECLRIALRALEETEGFFDITLGSLIQHRKDAKDTPMPPLQGCLSIDPSRPVVYCIEPGREIDLGGIGKGYALDRMVDLLKELAGNHALSGLISAGASSHLAFGDRVWQINLRGTHAEKKLSLHNQALSASGIEIQGEHIVRPDGQQIEATHTRLWVQHQKAADADFWSTAAMLMPLKTLLELGSFQGTIFQENKNSQQIQAFSPPSPNS